MAAEPSGRERIYLDHCATTPLSPAAAAAMAECQANAFGNPSSLHFEGRRARRVLEDAREAIAEILGARLSGSRPDQLIFTSGGTEANNLALLGRANLAELGIALAPHEHPSVIQAAENLAARGVPRLLLELDAQGVVDLGPWEAPAAPRWLALMFGNHETGVLQPVAEAAEACRARGGGLHCDAVQAAGKIALDFQSLGVDTLSVAAHKFHGPRGIGALLVRHGVPLVPLLRGGPQEYERRAGTEAVALAAGMQTALSARHAEREAAECSLASLRDHFEHELKSQLGIVIHGAGSARLPHISNVAFPGHDRQTLLMALDLAGVSCSAGSACASGSPAPSPTLLAMQIEPALVQSSLRFSLGRTTTLTQIDDAAQRIVATCRRLKPTA